MNRILAPTAFLLSLIAVGISAYQMKTQQNSGQGDEDVRIELVGLRIEEDVEETDVGTCRTFRTKFTLATQSQQFSMPADLLLKIRDKSPTDQYKSGSWTVHDCRTIPLGVGAFREKTWIAGEFPPEGVDSSRYVAACGFEIRKHCYDEEAGGAYEKKAISRERPKWELEFVSYDIHEGKKATLVQ